MKSRQKQVVQITEVRLWRPPTPEYSPDWLAFLTSDPDGFGYNRIIIRSAKRPSTGIFAVERIKSRQLRYYLSSSAGSRTFMPGIYVIELTDKRWASQHPVWRIVDE